MSSTRFGVDFETDIDFSANMDKGHLCSCRRPLLEVSDILPKCSRLVASWDMLKCF